VTLFYTDSPTNPHLKCIDIKLVAKLCHRKGTLVCIDSTLASPINQKPLTLGAGIVVHSATKYIAGHHDVSSCPDHISSLRQLFLNLHPNVTSAYCKLTNAFGLAI
jgi:hypothetical protein